MQKNLLKNCSMEVVTRKFLIYMKSKRKLIIVSLNELNFEVIDKHIQKYNLNNLAEIKKSPFTHSETEYKLLEPWIQWVSFYYVKNLKSIMFLD